MMTRATSLLPPHGDPAGEHQRCERPQAGDADGPRHRRVEPAEGGHRAGAEGRRPQVGHLDGVGEEQGPAVEGRGPGPREAFGRHPGVAGGQEEEGRHGEDAEPGERDLPLLAKDRQAQPERQPDSEDGEQRSVGPCAGAHHRGDQGHPQHGWLSPAHCLVRTVDGQPQDAGAQRRPATGVDGREHEQGQRHRGDHERHGRQEPQPAWQQPGQAAHQEHDERGVDEFASP